MLFNKKGSSASEKILYQTRPNMVVACKKVIYASILIAILIFIAPIIVGFISEMQVYLISYVKLSLTKYTAIALFVLILIIVLYMIWQLIGWYATEYTLTVPASSTAAGIAEAPWGPDSSDVRPASGQTARTARRTGPTD